jgi:hypothetical protein
MVRESNLEIVHLFLLKSVRVFRWITFVQNVGQTPLTRELAGENPPAPVCDPVRNPLIPDTYPQQLVSPLELGALILVLVE